MKTKFTLTLTLFMALIVQLTFAQQKTISGTVSDENGLPLLGATVVISGTSTGTTTDFDGNYKINANTGDVLTFSYVGYQSQNITVGASNTVNATLQLDNTLEEVVVTALGIKREEKALGYSIQKIDGQEFTEARESNLVNALSGKGSGIQVTNSSGSVGASSRIVLRGNSSITGNNEPLFVVDGVPIDNTSFGNAGSSGGSDLPNGVADINPDDIESISVLKGPSALYGMRGANGVILITTKSGSNKDGTYSVTVNSNATFTNALILPDFQNSYGQGANTNHFNFVDGASGGTNDGVDESWGPPLDAGLEFVQWNSQLNEGRALPWISHPDNVKNFFDTGVSINNSIAITKGGEKGSMRLSFAKSKETGIVPFTELQKLNIGFNGKMDLSKRFHAGISFNYIISESDNLATGGYNNENPMQQFIWSGRQVDFSALRDWRNFPLAPENTAAAGTPLNWNHNFQNNPYWVLETNKNTFYKDRVIGNVNFAYDFSDELTATFKYGRDQFALQTSSNKAKGSNENPEGYFQVINRNINETNIEFLLAYNTDINENFTFGLSAGANSMKRVYNRLLGIAEQLELPDLYTLTNIKSGVTPITSNWKREQRINSVYGFGSIGYKNYLFLEFTARNDWASVLPAQNNSFFYPSVSLSGIISDMTDLGSKIDYLKLRASWAEVGSQGVLAPYSTNLTYELNNTGFGNLANTPNTRFNSDIEPEKTTATEFGVDLRMFKSKLKLSATYYNQQGESLILELDTAPETGYTRAWKNAAEMSNTGIELSLGATVIQNDNFSLNVDFNWAKNNNEVVSTEGNSSVILGGQWGLRLEAIPGESYGSLVGRGFQRDPSGNVIYNAISGLPEIDNEYKILGNITPDWTGGVNISMSYKNFDFSTLIDAKIGGDLHSMSYSWGRYAGVLEETLYGRETGIIGDGVIPDGNGGYVQNNVVATAKAYNQRAFSNSVEESAIFDASYVKWRSLSIGYNLTPKLLKGTFLSAAKISLVGRNLAILHRNVPHIDPETGFSSANGEQGQEFGQLPSTRSIGMNINLKF